VRGAAILTLLATLGAEVVVGAVRPAEASALRRAYFRAETPDARRQIAPFASRELPGGIICAAIPSGTVETLAATPGLTFLGSRPSPSDADRHREVSTEAAERRRRPTPRAPAGCRPDPPWPESRR
jgi:hypothetical protein